MYVPTNGLNGQSAAKGLPFRENLYFSKRKIKVQRLSREGVGGKKFPPKCRHTGTPVYDIVHAIGKLMDCVQQIPRDKDIKNFFYAPEGYKLVQFDFAQAEIRVIASLANDENLITAITAGADMHKEVAAFMFNKSVADITPEERQAAKTLNFGVIYGMSAPALSGNLGISEEDAADKLNLYMSRFKGVGSWIKQIHEYAKRNASVVTPFGRIRHLPEVNLADRYAVSSALRQAQNSPIQATASDLTLWLLLYIFKKLNKDKSSFIISVHDSGLYMVHESYIQEFLEILKDGITKLNTRFTFLKVPMRIDIGIAEPDATGKSRWGKIEDVCSY